MRLSAKTGFVALAFASLMLGVVAAGAADYPNRVVTLVVPYPPGGGVDAMARVVAAKLSDALQPAGDRRQPRRRRRHARHPLRRPCRARRLYAAARPHRHDLDQSQPLHPRRLRSAQGFRARSGLVASMPVALLAIRRFRPRSIADVIALAKQQPGKLNVGTSALGTGGYMCAELFKSVAGIDVAIIPYKGTAPVMTDLLGGHVPVAFGVLPPALGNIQAGKLRAIAVTSKKRFSACCRRCRPSTNPGCRVSRRCCITGCWRRPARRRRSSSG